MKRRGTPEADLQRAVVQALRPVAGQANCQVSALQFRRSGETPQFASPPWVPRGPLRRGAPRKDLRGRGSACSVVPRRVSAVRS